MHIVEKISSLLNVKPQDESKLLLEYYSIPFNKYITIFNESTVPSNHYNYFNDIIDDIFPILEKENIQIIQLLNSDKDPKIKNCFYIDKFSSSQINYILKNSMLHICTDAYSNEIANILNIPCILLLGNRFPKSSKAWYSKNNNYHILSEYAFKKPTFSLQEFPKSIDKIKTEHISEKIFNIFNIDFHNKYSTLFIGSKYHEQSECDYIPNFILNDSIYSKFNLNIRLDKFYNEYNASYFCSNNNHTILTNKNLSINFLNLIKNKCKKIIYYINKSTDPKDIINLINFGIPLEMFYENSFDKEISFKFLDIGKINNIKNETSKDNFKLYNNKIFKTSKLILSNNKKYPSYAHLEKNIELGKINRCINDPLFWKDDSRYKIIGD